MSTACISMPEKSTDMSSGPSKKNKISKTQKLLGSGSSAAEDELKRKANEEAATKARAEEEDAIRKSKEKTTKKKIKEAKREARKKLAKKKQPEKDTKENVSDNEDNDVNINENANEADNEEDANNNEENDDNAEDADNNEEDDDNEEDADNNEEDDDNEEDAENKEDADNKEDAKNEENADNNEKDDDNEEDADNEDQADNEENVDQVFRNIKMLPFLNVAKRSKKKEEGKDITKSVEEKQHKKKRKMQRSESEEPEKKKSNRSMELRLEKGSIKATRQKVHDMLGIPMGSRKLEDMEQRPSTDPFIKEWEKQFKRVSKPTLAAIASVISDTTEADFMFRMNFITLFGSTMGTLDNGGKKRIKMETETRCLEKLEHHGEFNSEEEQDGMNVSEGTEENGSETTEGESDGKEENINGDDREVKAQIDVDNQEKQEKQDTNKDEYAKKEKVETVKEKQDKADKVDNVQEKEYDDKEQISEDEFWNTRFTDSQCKELGNPAMEEIKKKKIAKRKSAKEMTPPSFSLVLSPDTNKNEDRRKYDEVKQYKAFSDTMKNEFKKDDELKKLKDLEMVMSPTEKQKNIFSMHLKEVQHPRAKEVLNKKPTILRSKWGAEENNTDCEVFLMMHMVNYNRENARN
nr:hypothetical protein [Tanacetum cinerariifolium]